MARRTVEETMKEISIDLKTMITVLLLAGAGGGFWYTTQHRLDNVESKLEVVSQDVNGLEGQLKQIQKQLRKLNK